LTIKFSPTGSLIWEKVHFVRDQSFGKFIGIDAYDNIYITANYYRSVPNPTYPEESIGLTNVLLLKYNPSGDEVSSQTFISVQASSYDEAMSSKTDLQGNTYIAIASTAVWSFEIPSDFNYSIVKYNANAVQQWIQTYGNVGYETDDFPADLQIDSNNNVYVVGQNDAIGASMDITTIKYSQENLATPTFSQKDLSIFPNPVNDILNISYNKEISNISICNLIGQEVLTKNINTNQSKIDVSSLSSGSYLVKIVADNDIKTIKILKQ
jgi:uncharacterized protein RhaS with RHS repeats